jgi:hypothetical protein
MSKIGAIAQSDTSIITDGLIFNMDFSKFSCYPRTGTTATDMEGSLAGTAQNGASFSTDFLGTFDFDGVNDEIDLGNPSIFNTYPLTYEVWFRNDDTTDKRNNGLINKGNNAGNASQNGAIMLNLQQDGLDRFLFRVSDGSSFIVDMIQSATLPAIGAWAHIVAQWDGTTSTNGAKLYLDTSLIGQATATGTTPTTARNFYIGGHHDSTAGRSLDGKIAIARAYNRVLSADEISINYNAVKERFGL